MAFFIKGKVDAWITVPVFVGSENINDLRSKLSNMLTDTFAMPVMEIKNGKLVEKKGK